METEKDHIHLLVKSEPKVSILAIILKLKQETTIKYGKLKKRIGKKYYWKEIHYGLMDTSYLLSATLAEKQPRITYWARVEVEAYIHWPKTQWFYTLSY